jgi:hypothetical protein
VRKKPFIYNSIHALLHLVVEARGKSREMGMDYGYHFFIQGQDGLVLKTPSRADRK